MNSPTAPVSATSPPEWLTRTEFARLARISPVTAKRWAREGIGPQVHRIGPRLVRYRRSEVDAWMRGETPPAPAAGGPGSR